MLTAADIAALEEDEEPRKKKRRRPKMEWQLFVGGFGFPWSPGAVMQWLLIAFWATVAGWLVHSAIALGIDQALGGANMYQTIVAMLAALGAMLAGVGCAGRRRHPRSDDSPGNHRRQRPHGELAERRPFPRLDRRSLVHLQYGCRQRGAGIGPRLAAARPSWSARRLRSPSRFSSCSRSSCYAPWRPTRRSCRFRRVVFASLGRHGIAWLAFYLQAGGCWRPRPRWFTIWVRQLEPPLAIPLAALLFSAVVMIYFRLLGRLAFYCSVEPEEEEVEE